LGALLSTGGTWLQRHSTENLMRHREVGDAADDLRAGTQTLIMTVEAYGMAGRKQSLVTWVPLVSPQVERVQIAAERIIRHSTTELGASARAVADSAIAYVSGHNTEDDRAKVQAAIKAFTAELRKHKA
jgi:hypothetical protein